MIDPSSIAAGVELAKSAWSLLSYLRSIGDREAIAAYFSHDGTRLSGSEKLEVEVHKTEGNDNVWFYSVKPVDGYVFIREPVTPSCAHEMVGTEVGEALPDSRFWRWIGPVLPGRIYGGTEPPNLKVDFLVFGYRPDALIDSVKRK